MTSLDRILTIAITAAITSAGWFLAGKGVFVPTQGSPERDHTASAARAPTKVVTEAEGGLASGRSSATTFDVALGIPVMGVEPADLVDTFADRRDGGARFHEAIDIMASRGTYVVAAAPGSVEKIHTSEAGGKTIYIRSSDRTLLYYYAHLDSYAPGLREGAGIAAGDRIGTVGNSGNASKDAPHLHFALLETTADAEWWEPANAINPYPLLTSR